MTQHVQDMQELDVSMKELPYGCSLTCSKLERVTSQGREERPGDLGEAFRPPSPTPNAP